MFCNSCGKQLNNNAEFCSGCGAKLRSVSVQTNDYMTANSAAALQQGRQESWPLNEKSNKTEKMFKSDYASIKEKSSVGRKILVAFLCVILFIFMLSATTIGVIRAITASDNIENMAEDMSVSDVPIADENGETFSLSEWFDDEIYGGYADLMSYSENDFEEFFNSEGIREYIAEKAVGLKNDFYDGKARTKIRKNEIKRLIERNDPKGLGNGYEEYYGYGDPKYSLSSYSEEIAENFAQSEFAMGINIEAFENRMGNPALLSLARFVLSIPTMIVLIALSLILMFVLYRVNKKAILKTLIHIGIVMLIIGAIYLWGYIGVSGMTFFMDRDGALRFLYELLYDGVAYKLLGAGALTAIGLGLIAAGRIIRKKLKANM